MPGRPGLQRHILGNLAGMGKRRSRSIAADDAALSTVLDAGATGGPANAHGVAYQLQVALYEALPILAETLAAPYKDLTITLEVRAIHDQGITRWDLGIGAATRLLEVKTNASRADVMEWLERIGFATSCDADFHLVYAATSGALMMSLANLQRIAREAGQDEQRFTTLCAHEQIKDADLILAKPGKDMFRLLGRMEL